MGRTEAIFSGTLLFVIVALIVAVIAKRESSPVEVSEVGKPKVEVGSNRVAFTGDKEDDICMCYTQAFSYAKGNSTIDGLEYLGGFTECASRLGRDGENAWTWGWANGEKSNGLPGCRGYFASLRTNTKKD